MSKHDYTKLNELMDTVAKVNNAISLEKHSHQTDALVRLLDMLMAWSLGFDEAEMHLEAEEVANLYQQAGQLMDFDDQELPVQVEQFIINHLTPFILHGKGNL